MRLNDDDETVVVSNGDHAHACITEGGGKHGDRDGEDRPRICPLVRVTPALCRTDYKGFTRSQNIRDGCAFLIVEVVDG